MYFVGFGCFGCRHQTATVKEQCLVQVQFRAAHVGVIGDEAQSVWAAGQRLVLDEHAHLKETGSLRSPRELVCAVAEVDSRARDVDVGARALEASAAAHTRVVHLVECGDEQVASLRLCLSHHAQQRTRRSRRQPRRRGGGEARRDFEEEGAAGQRHPLVAQPDMQLIRPHNADGVFHTVRLDESAFSMQPAGLDAAVRKADSFWIGGQLVGVCCSAFLVLDAQQLARVAILADLTLHTGDRAARSALAARTTHALIDGNTARPRANV